MGFHQPKTEHASRLSSTIRITKAMTRTRGPLRQSVSQNWREDREMERQNGHSFPKRVWVKEGGREGRGGKAVELGKENLKRNGIRGPNE